MTKANDRARARVKDAERRARRKLKRLEAQGIKTGRINPIRKVDQSDTRGLNAYVKKLEEFISRKTRFVAGLDGQAIEYKLYKEYVTTRAKWEQKFDKLREEYRGLAAWARGEVRENANLIREKVSMNPYESRSKRTNVEQLTRSEVKNRIKEYKHQLTHSYDKKVAKQLRETMLDVARYLNSQDVANAVRGLSLRQLYLLHELTDFTQVYFSFITSDPENYESVFQAADDTNKEEYALELIKTIRRDFSNKKIKNRKRGK